VDLTGLAYLFPDVARLLWRDAQGIEGSLDLASTEIKVGRAMDCAIRTDDAMVSRHHARVFWGGGGYVLEDLSSANGVYFQEQRVQSHLFKHGDAVRCGSLWLRFVDTGGASAGPPAGGGTPMMQHPGIGAIAAAGPTGHVAAVNPNAMPGGPMPTSAVLSTMQGGSAPIGAPPAMTSSTESEVEIRVLRRRVEQLQTELRVYRSNKFNQDAARRM
jgi:predicted component of type VI protein secretion system